MDDLGETAVSDRGARARHIPMPFSRMARRAG
jgi:hypothetical protein